MDCKRRSSRTRFFKVLIRDDFNTRLRIPPAFVVNHLPRLMIPKRFRLTNCAGRFWHVNIEKVDNSGLFFTRGWKAFARDNSLQFGDFLVFKFNGVSKFSVRAYGLHACEKEVPLSARKRRRGESSAPIDGNNPKGNVRGGKGRGVLPSLGPDLKHEDSDPVSEPGEDAEETDLHGCEWRWSMLALKLFSHRILSGTPDIWYHPKFLFNFLQRIPWQFIKSNIQTGKHNAKLQYADRSWLVRLRAYPNFRGGFYEGWTVFAKSNKLQSGDSCLFELIDGKEIVFKASVHTNVD